MADDKMFQEAVNAVHQGQRERARDLLSRLLRTDQKNPEYWVWMSAVVDSANERVYCLQNALKLDPAHAAARRGLILAGALTDDGVTPTPPPKRRWSSGTDLQSATDAKKPRGIQVYIQKLPPFLRAKPVLFSILGVVVLICLLSGGFALRVINAPQPTRWNTLAPVTPNWNTPTPTITLTPTNTPLIQSPTPTMAGSTPLWAFLPQTYTPTPRYIDTPHPVSEAYRSGLRSYDAGRYEEMLLRMQQASQDEPTSADLLFYVGESYILLERYDEAVDAFSKAIKANPGFAPAYLGHARALLALDENADIQEDLDKAVLADRSYVDAYLERAAYLIGQGEAKLAIEDLTAAESLRPGSPMLYVLRAQAELLLGENLKALEDAQKGYQLDKTLLPAYITLARAHLANQQPAKALSFISVYTAYIKDDLQAMLIVGIAQYQAGNDYQTALASFDQVLKADKRNAEAYYYRGLTYLTLSDPKKATADLTLAVSLRPKVYLYNLDLGRALWAYDRLSDASRQFDAAANLAETDGQLAAVHYWHAQVFEKANNPKAAAQEWNALLELPEAAAPPEWLETARQHLQAMTPTVTHTSTPKPTKTPIPSATIKPTKTPKPSATPSPSKTPTSSQIPKVSPTPTS